MLPSAPPDGAAGLRALLDELPPDLLGQAFSHASWVDRRSDSYERLAFLGDVVLSLAVSTEMFPRFESAGAGTLTKLRAQAVSRGACASVARAIGVPDRLRAAAPATGKSADALLASERVLASLCESVIGAAYVALGFDRVAPAIAAAFADQVEEAVRNPVDFKSLLQERLAARGQLVAYRIVAEDGPPHDRRFVAVAEVGGEGAGRGEGATKKSAEQEAALNTLTALDGGVPAAGGSSTP